MYNLYHAFRFFHSTFSLSGVWGSHLNKKPTSKQTDSFSNSFSEMSFKFGLDTSQGATVKTRTSLKKRTRTFQSFTDTLGVTASQDLTNTSASQPIVVSSFTPEDENSLGSTDLQPAVPDGKKSNVTEQKEEEEEEEDSSLTLFPALSVKQSKAVVKKTGPRRKIDAGWLARCTGIQEDPGEPDTDTERDQDPDPDHQLTMKFM